MNGNIQKLIQSQAQKAKSAMRVLSRSSADVRNHALLAMAESLQNSKDKIQDALISKTAKKPDSLHPSCNASCWTTRRLNG